MGWFFNKGNDVLDLSERYRKQQERLKELKKESTASSSSDNNPAAGAFGIFGMSSSTTTTASASADSGYAEGSDADEKRRKLAKRLMDITDKIEDLGNQIYHIQQRLEVIEKKLNPSSY